METIYSLVTKPINQNIAVIRISGPDSFDLLNTLLKKPFKIEPNKVEYSHFFIDDNFIDEGLILSFVAPNSYTGENVVEIQTHGSMYVVEKILNFLEKQDKGRMAYPGEFTKQAFLNNKLDLTKASAINSLIINENKYSSKISSANLNNKHYKYVNKTISSLEGIISRMQVAIDYPENTDLPEYSINSINKDIYSIFEQVSNILVNSKKIQKLNEGIKIAIVGKPNVGKSTFINKMIGEDRIIVSDIQGTTRDVIDINLKINNVFVTLKDTAGLRDDSNDVLEKEGMKKTLETIKSSDLVIYLQDFNSFKKELPSFLNDSKQVIKVITKWDLAKGKENNLDTLDFVKISSHNNDINELISAIEKYIKTNIPKQSENDINYLTDKMQINMYEQIKDNLLDSMNLINLGYTNDYILFHLEDSLKILYKIIGKKIDPDYINNLFSNFCLGK